MVLHTLNALPDSVAFRDCLDLLADGDSLLLLGDAVYAAMTGSESSSRLQAGPAEVFLLAEDAAARGITGQVCSSARVVDMEGFVALTERFPRQLAWY